MRFAVLALAAACSCFAQSVTGGGTIQGAVKDATGSALSSAKITITHVESGVTTSTSTNSDGYFATPPLKIGAYKVRVEFPGMKAWETDVSLETGRTVDLSPKLELGAVSEKITVMETVPLVTTTDPTDGTTLDSRRIDELPVNGRDLNTLLSDVTPGIEQVIDVNGGVRSAGMMVYSTNYVQDGAASNNREFGGSMNLSGLASIGEVRVETSTSNAKYSSPASVIVTTKAGTNQVHGFVYETMRNNGFGVARARQDVNYDGSPYHVPKLIRNEFGGWIGGPVYLPKIYNGRNRTFFSFSREGQELRQGISKDFTVPTVAMRNGDFSQLFDAQGRFIAIYDPTTSQVQKVGNRNITTRRPFPGNIIPADRESPLAKFVYGITPLPTDITNPLVASNLKMAVATNGLPNQSNNPATARVDHRFTEKDNIFVKFNGGNLHTDFQGTGSTTGAPTLGKEANQTYLLMDALSGAFSWTHLFSPSFFVETNGNRTAQTTKTVNGPQQQDWSKQLKLPNPFGELGWPALQNLDFMNYIEGDNRRMLRTLVDNWEQNYTAIRGTHNLQFGWRWHREKQTLLPDQGNISGYSDFNSLATALESSTLGSDTAPAAVPQTGDNAANFFLGYGADYNVGLKRGFFYVTDRNYGLYFQDNYRVTSRLTLNMGLRWDLNPALSDERYLINGFDQVNHAIVLPQPLDYYYGLGATTPKLVGQYESLDVKFETAAQAGMSKNIFPSNMFDLGPRGGVAYRMFDGARTLVIRGGYGLYISPTPMRTLLAQFSSAQPFRTTYQYNQNSSTYSNDHISNWLLRNPPVYIAGLNTDDPNMIDLNNPAAIGRGASVVAMGDLPSMKIHEWNAALEKQIGNSSVFRIRYTGRHGWHADQLDNINPQPSNYVWYVLTGTALPSGTFSGEARRPYDQKAYTDIKILEKTGTINSSTFTVEFERRFSRGFGFQIFHTVTNATRLAGNSFRDSPGTVSSVYIPGTVPTDPAELNRFLNYQRDTSIPQHRTRWNWNYDLPVGRGKLLGRNSAKWVDNLIGGWKLSGSGTIVSSWFSMPTNWWGSFANDFQVYGTKYPILDCRNTPATARTLAEERCFQGYLYYNGYISNRFIDSRNAFGMRNGIFGLPADYAPSTSPVVPWPKGGQPTDPNASNYDTNNVTLTLKDGSRVLTAVDTGIHPWRQQYRLGPFNWSTDVSLLKFFNLRERLKLRMNFDVFNLFNVQGLNPPGSDGTGIVTLQNSYGGFGLRPRQVQVSARLQW